MRSVLIQVCCLVIPTLIGINGIYAQHQIIDTTFIALKAHLDASINHPHNSNIIAENHLKLGEYYHILGLQSEAMNQYNLGMDRIGASTSNSLYIPLNNNMGKVHLAMNNFELAEQYFNETLGIALEMNMRAEIAASKALLGSCFEKEGLYESALNYQLESLSIFKDLQDERGIAVTNENIGSIYEDLKNYDLARHYFIRAYGILENSKSLEEANILNNLGDVYRKTGDYPKAMDYTKKALDIANFLGDLHQLESAHKDLSKTFAHLGDFENAHKELVLTEKYSNTLLEMKNSSQLNVLQTIFQTKKKEAEIDLLKEQNKVSVARQNLLLVALFAIAVIFYILYRYLGRKRQAKIKIQDYKQRLLKAELEKKEVEERNLQQEVQLKAASLSRYSLHLSQKNKILFDLANTLRHIASRQNMDTTTKLKQLVKEIDYNLKQENEWDEFMNFFKEIHPEFIKKLSSLSEDHLSPAELRLGMLLRLNLSSKEIASILRVTPDSVRVARYRLRKKLPISQKEELVNYMIEL